MSMTRVAEANAKFYRDDLADELRRRCPELSHLADEIERLPASDPRFHTSGLDPWFDQWDPDEFADIIRPFMPEGSVLPKMGPNFTTEFLSRPAGKMAILGCVSDVIHPDAQAHAQDN